MSNKFEHYKQKHLDLDLALAALQTAFDFADCSKVPDEEQEALIYYVLDDVRIDINRIMKYIEKYIRRQEKSSAEDMIGYSKLRFFERKNPVDYGCDCGDCMSCIIAEDYCVDHFHKSREEKIKDNDEIYPDEVEGDVS